VHFGHGQGEQGLQEALSGLFEPPERWLACFAAYGRSLALAFFSSCQSAPVARRFASAGAGVAIGFEQEVPPAACQILATIVVGTALLILGETGVGKELVAHELHRQSQHFVEEYNRDYHTRLTTPAGALDCLFRHDWPGNVRELRLAVRKAAAYADQPTGSISALLLQEATRTRDSAPRHTVSFDPMTNSWRDFLQRAQTSYLRAVLAAAGGNKEAAAKLAGLSRSQFYEKLKESERLK